MRVGGTLYYLYNDHLNTASLTTGSDGAIQYQMRFYPYGVPYFQLGADVSDFGFTDQRNESTGLMDFDARYYDPLIGRFVSADTLVPGYENPQALNRYAYALGNPVNYVDPSGHSAECGYIKGGSCGWQPHAPADNPGTRVEMFDQFDNTLINSMNQVNQTATSAIVWYKSTNETLKQNEIGRLFARYGGVPSLVFSDGSYLADYEDPFIKIQGTFRPSARMEYGTGLVRLDQNNIILLGGQIGQNWEVNLSGSGKLQAVAKYGTLDGTNKLAGTLGQNPNPVLGMSYTREYREQAQDYTAKVGFALER